MSCREAVGLPGLEINLNSARNGEKEEKKSYLLFILSPFMPCTWQKNDQKKNIQDTPLRK